MIVSFANQKGGVGKSTHCALFAQYLSDRNKTVHVIDMDFQRSLVSKRESDKSFSLSEMREQDENVFDNSLNYTIKAITPDDILPFIKEARQNPDSVYIIDTPGSLAHENVVKMLYVSDFIIIPFDYSELKLDSTAVFIQYVKQFKIPSKLIFLPNDSDKRYKEAKPERVEGLRRINEILSNEGVIAPTVYHLADMQRFSTLEITNRQMEILGQTYDFLYNQLYY